MATTTSTRDSGAPVVAAPPARTGWTNWIVFASVMMMIGGALAIFQGLVAAINDEWVVWRNAEALYLDLSAWGWAHMAIGAVVLLCGVSILSGNILARAVGVFVASLSLVTNFMFMPAYPVWATIVIAVDVLVIWALIVHGREMRTP
jgi:hypothetical protein